MAYGQNGAWGMQAVKTTTGAPWNGQTSSYLIQSGYPNNIFKGDLVYLGGDGYIHNLFDLGSPTYTAFQAIGVFNGCSFVTTTATNPIDPASPGRPYWAAGTVTLENQIAIASIIDDPAVVFNIQSDAVGLPFSALGSTASVFYPSSGGGNPDGNFSTGQSLMILNSSGLNGNVLQNLKILRFVPVEGNVPKSGGAPIPYNNVEVIIQNHSFETRPAGI